MKKLKEKLKRLLQRKKHKVTSSLDLQRAWMAAHGIEYITVGQITRHYKTPDGVGIIYYGGPKYCYVKQHGTHKCFWCASVKFAEFLAKHDYFPTLMEAFVSSVRDERGCDLSYVVKSIKETDTHFELHYAVTLNEDRYFDVIEKV